jgi:hypothetical protein
VLVDSAIFLKLLPVRKHLTDECRYARHLSSDSRIGQYFEAEHFRSLTWKSTSLHHVIQNVRKRIRNIVDLRVNPRNRKKSIARGVDDRRRVLKNLSSVLMKRPALLIWLNLTLVVLIKRSWTS